MPIVHTRSFVRVAAAIVAIAALAVALCVAAPARAQPAGSATREATPVATGAVATRPATQPLFVAVTGGDVWVTQRMREMLDPRDITIIRRMSTAPNSDARYREADTLRGDVVDVAASGDRLAILFADGSWGWIAPGGTFTAAQSPDRTYLPVALAGQGDSLWFLCRRPTTSTASTVPSTARAAEPEGNWLLLKRERTGVVSFRQTLWHSGPGDNPGVAVAMNGDVVVAIDGLASCLREGRPARREPFLGALTTDRIVPLDGWPVAALVTSTGTRIELIEWNVDALKDSVRLQLDESIAKDRWAVAVANGELRFVARSTFGLIDQIVKADGSAVRGPQPLQLLASDRASPGAQAVHLAMMLTLGAIVTIVWLRATRPGAAGVVGPASRPVDAAGKPVPLAAPAPLPTRCLAASIDYMPVWLILGTGVARQTDLASLNALLFAAVVGYIVYCTVCEIVFGRTIGKRMLRLRVATLTGGKPSVGAIALRNALRVVEAMPPFLVFAIISMMITPMRQRLGDFVAGTTVVPDEDVAPRPEPAGSPDDSVQNPTGSADDKESK